MTLVLTDLRIGAPRGLVSAIEDAAFGVAGEVLKHLQGMDAPDSLARAQLIADTLAEDPLVAASMSEFARAPLRERIRQLTDTATIIRLTNCES